MYPLLYRPTSIKIKEDYMVSIEMTKQREALSLELRTIESFPLKFKTTKIAVSYLLQSRPVL